MKKTLITLSALAMASVASAAVTNNTYSDEDFKDGILNLDTALTFDQDWKLTLTASFKGTFERTNDTYYGEAILTSGSTPFADNQMIRVYHTDDDNSLRETLFTLNGSQSSLNTNPSMRLIGSNTLTFSYDVDTRIISLTVSGTYTTANDGTGATAFEQTITSSRVAVDAEAISKFSSSVIGDSNYDITSISTSVGSADPVPEPATATLSLLALAGLAARRRRK